MDCLEQKPDGSVVVALLDFPKGGTVGLDGQNIVLKTDDFVGIKNVPPRAFHLVTCKNGNASNSGESARADTNNINTAVTVGFLVYGDGHDDGITAGGHLIRRYDPRTEEVASHLASPVDDLTRRNLLQQIQARSSIINPSRVLSYEQLVQGSNSDNHQGGNERDLVMLSQQRVWGEQTRFINKAQSFLLNDLRGLSSGEKIVPGCYDPENETTSNGPKKNLQQPEADGRSMVYPPIPVVDLKVSLATHKHTGTARFLSRLEPSERTKMFLLASGHDSGNNFTEFVWLNRILSDYYQNSWEALLGDLQLSYLLFLYLGCYSSLEHWKDLLAMLSLAVDDGDREEENSRKDEKGRRLGQNRRHEALYRGLLRLLPYQLSSMTDPEFLEDLDEGGGNFLIPSLARLNRYYEARGQEADLQGGYQDLISKFRHVLSTKFPQTFFTHNAHWVPTITRLRGNSDVDNGCSGCKDTVDGMDIDNGNENCFYTDGDYSDEDEEGPVVVSSEEIEASLARSSHYISIRSPATQESRITVAQLRKEYPLLTAAVMSHEDILMTCARALDDKNDASLVREAAAYLEEVEQHRQSF